MKMTKLIYPLALALAVTMTGAGCKHTPPPMTPLPGVTEPPAEPAPSTTINNPPSQQPVNNPPPDNTPPTLPPAVPINPTDNNPTNTPYAVGTPITNNATWDPKDYVADVAALAANTVHFAFDSAVVKSGEEGNISAVAAYLTSNVNDKLMIEGNCDERGTEEYNRSLGERRALALREALATKNIDPQRVRTISYGKDKPVDPGHDESAWAKNRRGDFVIYHPKAAGM